MLSNFIRPCIVLLLCLNLFSVLALIFSSFYTRQWIQTVQRNTQLMYQQQLKHNQLLLEYSMLSAHSRVRAEASALGLVFPDVDIKQSIILYEDAQQHSVD